MCVPLCVAHADDSEINDAAARMQYAFYTRDARSLEEILRQLGAMESDQRPGAKEYYEAYGNWKLSQLYAEAQAMGKAEERGSSDKAAQECARDARAAASADPRMAEAYAIEAICSSATAFLIGGNCSRSKSLRNALEMEPQNPRIRLIEYLCDEKDKANVGLQRLRTVVSTFDTAAPSRPGKPDWGQAEALVLLGQAFLTRGDAVAARDALEKSLVLAPDYRKAQELLQMAAARPK
jgi:Tfp pilus assembly protein PilF